MTKLLLLALIFIFIPTFLCALWPSATESNLVFVTTTPTPTASPVFSDDLTVFRQAMKSDFYSEVDQAAAQGITRYQIEAQLLAESLEPPAHPKLTAKMAVRYTNAESVLLNQVYFRLFPNTPAYGGNMTVHDLFVNGQPAQTNVVSGGSAIFVPFRQALDPGDTVEITLAYEATVPITTGPGNGLYAYDQHILALAGFYPTIPVFDHNGWHLAIAPHYADSTHTDVALYDIAFTLPANWVLVSSGTTIETQLHADGSQTRRLVSGPMRDFFIALSPAYHSLSREVNGTVVTSYFLAGDQIMGDFILDVGANALAQFNDLIGPYPYQEFDLAAVPVPGTLGGVEYPGIVALANRYYAGTNTTETQTFIEFVTAHEVAHQWWYGLVGNDQVTYPWLDEALTQYTTIHYYENRYGANKRDEMSAKMFTPFYWQLRDTGSDRPVFGQASEFPEHLYYPVVYGKGPLFFEAVRAQIGDSAYFASLRQYAQQYRYGIATPQNLLDAFAQTSGRSVEEIYQQWILGE